MDMRTNAMKDGQKRLLTVIRHWSVLRNSLWHEGLLMQVNGYLLLLIGLPLLLQLMPSNVIQLVNKRLQRPSCRC